VLLVVTWYAAFHVGFVQHADQSIYRQFGHLRTHPHVGSLAWRLATLCDPTPYVYLCAVPVAIALIRRRPWVAMAIVAILLGANVTTQLLKPLLAQPRASSLLGGIIPPTDSSWPSGHATAAMSLALASVLAVPARLRPLLAALGAAFAVGVSYSFLTLQWHYPTDVFGGFLVAAVWALLGAAAVFTARRPAGQASESTQRISIRAALGPPGAAVLGALVLLAAVFLARPHQVVDYARAHELFVGGVAAIGALGLALATGLMLALRR
jgi:membrane-associated phospholipid phosphatase